LNFTTLPFSFNGTGKNAMLEFWVSVVSPLHFFPPLTHHWIRAAYMPPMEYHLLKVLDFFGSAVFDGL